MYPISVIIPAHDGYGDMLYEAHASAITISKNVIIVDHGLDKKIKENLSRKDHTEVITWKGTVPYIETIREELKQYAKHDWIFFLDPDEKIPETLVAEVQAQLTEEFSYVSMPRKNIILSRFIQHGRWWPDYQVRLFKKSAVKWPKQLHSEPTLSGLGLTLEPKEEFAIEHTNYVTVDQLAEKTLRYAKATAMEYITSGKPYTLSKALRFATSEFMSRFFAAQGYKDGTHGFLLAINQFMHYVYAYLYYFELKSFATTEEPIQKTATQFINNFSRESFYWLSKEGINKGIRNLKEKILSKIIR